MVAFTFVVAAVLVVCVSAQGRRPLQEKLDTQDYVLDKLTARLAQVSKQLEEAAGGSGQSGYEAANLERALDDLAGVTGGCHQGDFPCSYGDAVQCVKNFLVCDGSNDCKNGADEAKDICDRNIFSETRIMDFVVYQDHCGFVGGVDTVNTHHQTHWILSKAETFDWFPSAPQVPTNYTYRTESDVGTVNGFDVWQTVFKYATGDLYVPYDPAGHGLVGTCKYERLSAKRISYSCNLYTHLEALDNGRDPCWKDKNYITLE